MRKNVRNCESCFAKRFQSGVYRQVTSSPLVALGLSLSGCKSWKVKSLETGLRGRGLTSAIDDLLAAAFGANAGPAGPVDTPAGRAWLRAVALAGEGRFAAARVVSGTVAHGPFASAARCLEASMLRQSGRHAAASTPDGVALALALPVAVADGNAHGSDDAGLGVALRVDAAVGLAADALGVGRFALSARMLERADGFLAVVGDEPAEAEGGPSGAIPWWTVPRARLRRDWVAAELAVYSGDGAGAAAAVGTLLATAPGPARPRHHAKTTLIAAGAAMVSGDAARAQELVTMAYDIAATEGLNPLQWAGAKMMSVMSAEGHGEQFVRDAAATEARWIRDGADLARL